MDEGRQAQRRTNGQFRSALVRARTGRIGVAGRRRQEGCHRPCGPDSHPAHQPWRRSQISSSLKQYLAAQQERSPGVPAQLADLIESVAGACAAISDAVNRGAITDVLGSLEQENVQGEVQKKLDVIANEIMIEATLGGGQVRALASEEMDTVLPVPPGQRRGDYLLVFDPIDGSSNIDVNGVVGTIFSILRAQGSPEADVTEADFLQPGSRQVAAGYAIYGPQTLLVLTVGAGVHVFALDRGPGTWIETAAGITIPATTREFAINMAYQRFWQPPVAGYIADLVAGETGPRSANFNMRWMASMVGDLHRILTRGGIFLYPTDRRPNMASGKLRLLYEASPMAMLIEQAGGLATNGRDRILDIQPTSLHQRVGVVLGSAEEVQMVAERHGAA